VVLVLEDLQWGDALTLKLVEAALRDLTQEKLFVLALGRPELEEIFPRLLGDQRALSLSLRALSTKASELLVKGVLGDQVAGEPLTRMVRLAAGNALFFEELIRAAARLHPTLSWRIHLLLGEDLLAAVKLAEQAAADLAESQVMYRLSLAPIVQSFAWWGLGDHPLSENTARQARETAREVHDDYHAALADWYLGLALSEQRDPANEALFVGGDRAAGARVLGDALLTIERRAVHLRDTVHLKMFLQNRPENVRARELARARDIPSPASL
jgi:hypothetical protein